MEKQVKELKEVMESLQRNKDIYAEKFITFSNESASLSEAIQKDKDKIESLKAEIDPLAIQAFIATGKKKLIGGLGIQEKNKITYDPEKALKFAKEKLLFLQLDKKAFEKVAIDLKLDFVKSNPFTLVTYPKEIKL